MTLTGGVAAYSNSWKTDTVSKVDKDINLKITGQLIANHNFY